MGEPEASVDGTLASYAANQEEGPLLTDFATSTRIRSVVRFKTTTMDDAVRAQSGSVGAEGLEPPTCWL
jgi:hypothetical protein